MADEIAKRDENTITVNLGIIDDTTVTTDGDIKQLRLTKEGYLKVAQAANLSGIRGDALKVTDENTLLLKEVSISLKILIKILNEVHDLNVNETDIQHG